MFRLLFTQTAILLFPLLLNAQIFNQEEITRFNKMANNVKIIRDNYGIAHVYGKTDADAVFGMLYAQCEDDFKRIELNYIEKLGKLSEINGEIDLYKDLQIHLLIDTVDAKKEFEMAEPWLKKLMVAFADGINFYLYKNPSVKPQIIKKFKPWHALLWTDGSIGAISTGGATLNDLKNFYSKNTLARTFQKKEDFIEIQTGSNGFALGPAKTKSKNSILYINPHVTFYFRPEIHVKSNEGLNSYGAVTWGQFFIYQGFNEYCGWMHTSSAVDVADLYEETIIEKGGKYFSKYNDRWIPIEEREIRINVKEQNGVITKIFKAYFSHHGPIVAKNGEKWIALKSFNRSIKSLTQSWLRTKAKGLEDFKKTMDIRANTSNNTVFADNKGNIAYWHGNFIPKRDSTYNWTKPVDGSTNKTDWNGLHSVEESVHVYNPLTAWIQNCNSSPFTSSGTSSPNASFYAKYMAPDGENFRAINAIRLLNDDRKHDINSVINLGYEPTLEAFKVLIPALINAYNQNSEKYKSLKPVIDTLSNWNYKSSINSVATTIAVEWGQKINNSMPRVYISKGEQDQVLSFKQFARLASADQLLDPLIKTINELGRKYNSWNIAWGEINRFQRIDDNINAIHNDNLLSYPVGETSATWGQLASFNSRVFEGTNKRYGYSGNSFICVVEFGAKIIAKSLLVGGNSGNKNSPNFNDQGKMFAEGKFKNVLFYDEDINKNAIKTYKPGD
ncbi:penicillin acylase family protein [Pedobacter flavus]|uniref:Penicillin acylase family protein n=1 Tax=Pedobacter flavus TaxID=3113906 RepID=A0ABU7GYU4_9SPHI|nr:penicillin acylase family protein [Pedobacter sp. VNH31]MEE1884171.1 penicillin acylase family protein [Pedobacter sp. VNH31]